MKRRSDRFRAIAEYHEGEYNGMVHGSLAEIKRQFARNEDHEDMRLKYARAACYPFLTVEPDPPAPPPGPPDLSAE